jgi:hypothetical protein
MPELWANSLAGSDVTKLLAKYLRESIQEAAHDDEERSKKLFTTRSTHTPNATRKRKKKKEREREREREREGSLPTQEAVK